MVNAPEAIAEVVSLNGGKIVGRTRLQKTLYFLEVAHLGYGFDYDYYHYGPYSEEVATSARDAEVLQILNVDWRSTADGIEYAVYTAPIVGIEEPESQQKRAILGKLASVDSITLELAATANFLERNGFAADPWAETAIRKPSKATPKRIEKAKALLADLGSFLV
ncbi:MULTISPECIES: hypothetical protein [unclassified Xanthobacter]|uniref:hypothetical protein n=1 Tax=unclassified Xanthobacter TaxID=2623496 RepID=UPI001EDE1CCD|nr:MULTISPECIES: hypothetical protein [unclassified Xanthobacter]